MTGRPWAPLARPRAEWLPVLGALLLALAVALLRAPIPIDETRYLEVFRENCEASPLLLRLNGEPYAEKPPLLFWLGRIFDLGVPTSLALRLVPALAAALTAFFTVRLARRVNLETPGWLQVSMLLPFLSTQFLFFDALLSATVVGALDAWVHGRSRTACLWSALALLAKGPVAFLFLVPFFWALAPLSPKRHGHVRRAAGILGLALVPLAAWALGAAHLGGRDFANALLWDRWAGRIASGGTKHARSLFYYVPVLLFGALPATGLLFRRAPAGREEWHRRVGWAIGAVGISFTLIRGKQPHYLVPLFPALALYLALQLERLARAERWLLAGLRLLWLVVAGGVGFCLVRMPTYGETFTLQAEGWIASGGFRLPLLLALAPVLVGAWITWRSMHVPRALLAIGWVSLGLALLPVHWLAGQLLYPHALATALRAHPAELAYLQNHHHGLYALLAQAPLERLEDEHELSLWSQQHPRGWILVDREDQPLPAGYEVVVEDIVHRTRVAALVRSP